MAETRRRRAKGEESRRRILDAAAEIAGERGYEGTSVALVSERSGLPASSIYWHFKDKDELLAAVIDRSYTSWVDATSAPVSVPPGASAEDVFTAGVQRTGAAIAGSPDFLRLGLMLILERRPEQPTARRRFLQVRAESYGRLVETYTIAFGADLDEEAVRSLATLTMAAADGLFIAWENEHIDLAGSFELLAAAVLGAARHLGVSRR